MRWQFGGNFYPVRVICEENWKQCPIAFVNYVWSEIVTEVAECLANDIFVWKIIGMIVVFIILVHTVYYKLRWMNETSINRENLNRVGFKVQDLELKVNILTYKMQYGTWPLPYYMRKSEVGNEVHNVRLTLSNSEERNSWIKHLLLSPRKNNDYTLCRENVNPPTNSLRKLLNLETKYISSKFRNDVASIESGDKNVQTSDNLTRKWKRCKKYFDITLSKQRQISKSENLGVRRQQSPKAISLLKKEKHGSQKVTDNFGSSETFTIRKDSEVSKKREKDSQIQIQNQGKSQEQKELSDSYSDSINTCSNRTLYKENKLETDSSYMSDESDVNHMKIRDEIHLEETEEPGMKKLTRTESKLELVANDTSSISEMQSSEKSSDDTFYSWTDHETIENTPRNKTLKLLPPSLNIALLTKPYSKLPSLDKRKELDFRKSLHRHSANTTQKTLHQVREKLESLHNVLLAYELKDCNEHEGNLISKDCIIYRDEKSKKSNKLSINMNVKESLKSEEEILSSSEYEQCESIIQSSSTSLSVQSYSNMFSIHREMFVHNSNYNRFDSFDSESETERSQTKLENNSNVSINTFTKIQIGPRDNLPEIKSEFSSKSDNVNINVDRITMLQNPNYITIDNMEKTCVPMDTSEDQFSRSSSQAEFSNDETSDNQSTSALLQEALQFKDALVSQIEREKEMKKEMKNIIKVKEEQHDFRKNPRPKVDNYFQPKVLDIISEEQSASSSNEKTSKTFVMTKVSEEKDTLEREETNSRTALASTSLEYFSFSNLPQSEQDAKEFKEIELHKENPDEFQSEDSSTSNKRIINSEIRPNDLIKRAKQTSPEEREERLMEQEENEDGRESFVSSKQLKNFNEQIWSEQLENEKPQEEIKQKNKTEYSLKDYEGESENQRMEETNLSTYCPPRDSSSDESLMQFIKELTNDKAKAAKIFRESKLNLNSGKNEEKTLKNNELQEQESSLTLQRRPGCFSLAENASKEKPLNSVEPNSTENDTDFQRRTEEEKSEFDDFQRRAEEEESEFDQKKDMVDENVEKSVEYFDYNSNNPGFSPRSVRTSDKDNFKEQAIKEETNEELLFEVSQIDSECMKYPELKRSESKISLKEKAFETFDNQENSVISQSNLTRDPSSSLYFTAEASTSDIKLNEKPLSCTSNSKMNLEVEQTIFEDANESLTLGNQMCNGECDKLNENSEKEKDLIDLSDNNISEQKTEIEKPKISHQTSKEDEHSNIDKLNILDATFEEKIKENVCLIPKKIQTTNGSDTTFHSSSGVESHPGSKSQELFSASEMNLFERSTNNSVNNTIKISEMNKFFHCPGPSFLQRSPWHNRKNSESCSSFAKSKQKSEVQIKSKTLVRTPGSRKISVENSKESEKRNYGNSSKENTTEGKQPTVKSQLHLNLTEKKSGEQFQKRSRSFVSPRIMQTSPRLFNNLNNEGVKSARGSNKSPLEVDQQVRFTSKTSIKSVESQKSSKSCIPILKSRLENIRKPECKTRSQSPMRGPLTISPRSDHRVLKDAKESNIKPEVKEEKNFCNEKSFGDNKNTISKLLENQSQGSKEQTVMYVNIVTGQDQAIRKVVDQKKFLELMKDRGLEIHNVTDKNDSKINSQPNILTVVSSALEDTESSKRNLQSKFLFQVKQNEREVSVKPSVMDNSTSISDFYKYCDNEKEVKGKFQIFQVPEELTKEEYINLLDTLNQDPNLKQLKKMHKLCSKLGLGFQE